MQGDGDGGAASASSVRQSMGVFGSVRGGVRGRGARVPEAASARTPETEVPEAASTRGRGARGRGARGGGGGGDGGDIDMDADMDVSADNVFEIIERCRTCLKKHTHVKFRAECDEVLMVCIEILATQRLIGITSFFNCQVKELLNKIRNEQILASECAYLLKGCMLFQIAVMHCNIYNIEA
jgi:hypothetical protein